MPHYWDQCCNLVAVGFYLPLPKIYDNIHAFPLVNKNYLSKNSSKHYLLAKLYKLSQDIKKRVYYILLTAISE